MVKRVAKEQLEGSPPKQPKTAPIPASEQKKRAYEWAKENGFLIEKVEKKTKATKAKTVAEPVVEEEVEEPKPKKRATRTKAAQITETVPEPQKEEPEEQEEKPTRTSRRSSIKPILKQHESPENDSRLVSNVASSTPESKPVKKTTRKKTSKAGDEEHIAEPTIVEPVIEQVEQTSSSFKKEKSIKLPPTEIVEEKPLVNTPEPKKFIPNTPGNASATPKEADLRQNDMEISPDVTEDSPIEEGSSEMFAIYGALGLVIALLASADLKAGIGAFVIAALVAGLRRLAKKLID